MNKKDTFGKIESILIYINGSESDMEIDGCKTLDEAIKELKEIKEHEEELKK